MVDRAQGTASLLDQINGELTAVQRELDELRLLLRQAAGEVDRVSQRVANLAERLREIEATLEAQPRASIRSALLALADEQARLRVMEGHRDQVQSKIRLLERFQRVFTQLLDAAYSGAGVPAERQDGGDLLAKIVQAQEDERHRLARQIHDGPAQSLTNVVLRAEICRRLIEVDPARARGELDELKIFINTTLQETRRFIFDLRPMILDDLGLVPTLRRYIQSYGERSKVPVELTVLSQDRRWPLYVEVALFRIVQEAIENATVHAGASRVQVTLALGQDEAAATVEDNGHGFAVEPALREARQRKTLGLASMLERADLLGGRLAIESGHGRGTRVRIQVSGDRSPHQPG